MPEHTVPAAGGAMPASGHKSRRNVPAADHADTELLALCERWRGLRAAEKAASAAMEEAELRSAPPDPPAAILKTEADSQMRLFAGTGVGNEYSEQEIAAIRTLHRTAAGRTVADAGAAAVWKRTKAILEAWTHWLAAVEADDARSGMRAATETWEVAYKAADRAERAIIYLPAHTLAGVIAKATIAFSHVSDLERIDDRIAERMHLFGPDDDTGMLAILRDLVVMGEGTSG
jgi:hypothetical protein